MGGRRRRVGLGRTRAPAAQGIRPGTQLPVPLPVVDQHGNRVSLTFAAGRPTVLYVLSPLCGWCSRNEANIAALTTAAGSRFDFVGLSLVSQKLEEYAAGKHAPFPIYVLSPEMKRKFGFGLTPETLVVGSDGTVQKAWQGAYQDRIQQEIEHHFGVKLPGLQQAKMVAEVTNVGSPLNAFLSGVGEPPTDQPASSRRYNPGGKRRSSGVELSRGILENAEH